MPSPMSERSISRLTSQADVIICLLVRWMITSSGSKRGIEGERYFPSLIGAGIQLAPK
jgi:hypothetical protein